MRAVTKGETQGMATAPGQIRKNRLSLSNKRTRWLGLGAAGLWILIATGYFFSEVIYYRGIYEKVSEWQFDLFGHYFPILNFALLITIVISPAVLLIAIIARFVETKSLRRKVLVTSNQFRNILLGLTMAFSFAAIATLAWTLTLPRMNAPFQHVYADQPTESLRNGAATLSGYIIYERTSAYTQRLLLKRRGVRFAPVVPPGQTTPNIQYFVELAPSDVFIKEEGQPISTRGGILMRNALPGSLESLYRYAGYELGKPYFVLYTSERTMRWPYYVSAIQLAVIALFLAIATAIQHRRTIWVSSNLHELKRRKQPSRS